MILDGETAFASTLRNRHRKFPDRTDDRFDAGGVLFPACNPGFGIEKGASVFTIGSCFARNVERVLVAAGVNVPTAAFSAPESEAPGQPNRVLNQYNPGTMLQCVTGAGDVPDRRGLYDVGGAVVDCLLATGSRAVDPARAMARRAEISTLYAEGLAASSTVVVTLGLIEVWYDRDDALFLNEAPPRAIIRACPGRFEMRRLEGADCEALVSELVERLCDGGRRNIVLTVSPVPLQVTFTGGDAVVANAYSKSVLRAAAGRIADAHPNVDYFPSYEIVTSAGLQAFGDDNVHVRPALVEQVIDHMLGAYMPAAAESEGQPSAA